jgi:hypothetical protein
MDLVLKQIAQQHPPWVAHGTWLHELQGAVGHAMKRVMQRDVEWDAYIISQVLRKFLQPVYLARSTCCNDDDKSEILRNSIHQVGFVRDLLGHNKNPSMREMFSCIYAAVDVCKAFPQFRSSTVPCDLYERTVAALEDIAASADSLSNLGAGVCTDKDVDVGEVSTLLLDMAVTEFEDRCGAALNHARGSTESLDFQTIRGIILNYPKITKLREILRQRSKSKKPEKLIAITEAQIETAFQAATSSRDGVTIIDAALDLKFITLDQAKSVLLDGDYGKNASLDSWVAYKAWKDLEVDAAESYFDQIARGRNSINHGEVIALPLCVSTVEASIELFILLGLDHSVFEAMKNHISAITVGPMKITIEGIDRSDECIRIPVQIEKTLFGRDALIGELRQQCIGIALLIS